MSQQPPPLPPKEPEPIPVQPTLASLLKQIPQPDIVRMLQENLAHYNYPITDWQSGAVGRTHIEIDAETMSDLSLYIQKIAEALFIGSSRGPWLDLAAGSQYGAGRMPSQFSEGDITVTCEATFGPYRLPSPWWVQTIDGLRFRCPDPLDIPSGAVQTAHVIAEEPGPIHNVPDNTITQMLTPLPGLSVTNAAGWQTVAGAHIESDERLRERCSLQWPELGSGATYEAYICWALEADPAVQQVQVLDQNPRGPGTLDVVIWGEGGIGTQVVADVDAYIQQRRPLTSNVWVYPATPVTVVIQADCYVRAQFRTSAEAQAQNNLRWLQQHTKIGSTLYTASIIEQIMLPAGMINVVLHNPPADLVLGQTEAAVFDLSGLVWTDVRGDG